MLCANCYFRLDENPAHKFVITELGRVCDPCFWMFAAIAGHDDLPQLPCVIKWFAAAHKEHLAYCEHLKQLKRPSI